MRREFLIATTFAVLARGAVTASEQVGLPIGTQGVDRVQAPGEVKAAQPKKEILELESALLQPGLPLAEVDGSAECSRSDRAIPSKKTVFKERKMEEALCNLAL